MTRGNTLRAALLCALLTPVAVCAQPAPAGAALDVNAIAAKQTASQQASLGLSDAQAKQVGDINLKTYTAVAQLFASQKGVAKPDVNALAANLKSILTGKDKALQQVLTGTQMSTYKQQAPQRLVEFETSAMRFQLQLSDAQTSQVAQINAAAIQAMAPILKQMPGLRPLQKKKAGDQLAAISQKRTTQLQGVLTGAQMQKYQAGAAARSEFIKAYLQK